MDSQNLVDELARLKEGQPGAESRVLFVLSRTSLFILADGNVDDSGDQITVRVRLVDVEGRPTAYLFSSEESLREWCTRTGYEPNALPIHGGDVEFLLPKDTWMQLDPDSPHSALLSPHQLALVNKSEVGELAFIPVEGENLPSVRDPAHPFQIGSMSPALAEGPVKRKYAPRTHPTTLFTAPDVEPREGILKPRERTYTSSNLRKVIRALKEEEGGGGEEGQ